MATAISLEKFDRKRFVIQNIDMFNMRWSDDQGSAGRCGGAGD